MILSACTPYDYDKVWEEATEFTETDDEFTYNPDPQGVEETSKGYVPTEENSEDSKGSKGSKDTTELPDNKENNVDKVTPSSINDSTDGKKETSKTQTHSPPTTSKTEANNSPSPVVSEDTNKSEVVSISKVKQKNAEQSDAPIQITESAKKEITINFVDLTYNEFRFESSATQQMYLSELFAANPHLNTDIELLYNWLLSLPDTFDGEHSTIELIKDYLLSPSTNSLY